MRAEVQCTITGLSAEKLLNQARRQGIMLRGVKRADGGRRGLTVRTADYEALRRLAAEAGFAVSEGQPVGAFRQWTRVRKRWALAAGAAVCVGLMIWALGYVWAVRIEGAGPYEGEVRAFLEETGVVPGVRRARVSLGELREKLEWRLPQVKWVRVSWQGVALRVSVEEGTPPPDIETEGEACDVVADRDGLLLRLTVFAGTPRVKDGQFVRAGQVLIEGREQGAAGGPVKARGEALARVWTVARVRLPLTAWHTVPTGRRTERRVIVTPLFSWCTEREPEYLTRDGEITETAVGGAWIPVTLRRETSAEAALEKENRDPEAVMKEAETAAMRLLNQRLKNAETVDKWINFRMIEGDTIVAEAAGERIVSIGRCKKNGTGTENAP